MRSHFFAAILIFLLILPKGVGGEEPDFPFRPGEELTFRARWGFIPAGEAVLRVLPMETVNGVKSYHFVMTARTYPYIDIFYKVRDRIDSFTNADMTHSILYKKRKAGKSKRDVVVRFDWERHEAQYANFGQSTPKVGILPGTFDPLSLFYAFRLNDLEVDKEFKTPVTDGKKYVMGKAKVKKRAFVTVESGTYDTYLVEPSTEHIGGVFEKSKNAKLEIWVTADELRMPVKIRSKLAVGSFIAELISARGVLKDISGPHPGKAKHRD